MTPSTAVVIALVFLVGLVLGGVAIWLLGRRRTPSPMAPKEKPAADVSFRLSYIALPGAVALVTIITLAALYPSLPAELAFRFSSSGTPQSLIGRELFIGLMIGAQCVVAGLAVAVAFSISGLARRLLTGSPAPTRPRRIIWLMVNMLVLPQLLVAFVALDAAYYARNLTHVMTPWLFTLLTIGIGTLVLIVLFVLSFNETRRDG
ncbi:MAG: hypothetical protein FWH51_04180 [Dehalococcoidia bacterium]|nr:hypothetical protein [Dehalococcoidia bacterium]